MSFLKSYGFGLCRSMYCRVIRSRDVSDTDRIALRDNEPRNAAASGVFGWRFLNLRRSSVVHPVMLIMLAMETIYRLNVNLIREFT